MIPFQVGLHHQKSFDNIRGDVLQKNPGTINDCSAGIVSRQSMEKLVIALFFNNFAQKFFQHLFSMQLRSMIRHIYI